MTRLRDISGPHRVTALIPVVGATAGTDFNVAAFRAPFKLTVTAVRYLPNADLTGVTATEATLKAVNRGAAGTGTTVIASTSFDDDNDAVAFVDQDLTLSATAANLVVAEGSVVAIEKTHTSTGLALGGQVEIEFVSAGV